MLEKIRDNVKLELIDLGEGLSGEFDENDPSDRPLLRLAVNVKGALRQQYETHYGQVLDGDEVWGELPKASYCTSLEATAPMEKQQAFLDMAMDQLYQLVVVDRYQTVLRQLTHMA